MNIKAELREKELVFLLEKQLVPGVTLFGIRHGFLNDDLRAKAFNLLFNVRRDVDVAEVQAKFQAHAAKRVEDLPEGQTIINDVNRSLIINTVVGSMESKNKEELKRDLANMIKIFFLTNPNLFYYQGFNSVAETFMLTYGTDYGYLYLTHFADMFLRQFLAVKQFAKAVEPINDKIMRIVQSETKIEFESDQLMMTVGWVVSFFSHYITRNELLWRVWDFLICLKLSLADPRVLAKELPQELWKSKVLNHQEKGVIEQNLKRLAPIKSDEILIEYVIGKILIYFINREGSLEKNTELRFKFIKDIPFNTLDESEMEMILLRSLSLIQTV